METQTAIEIKKEEHQETQEPSKKTMSVGISLNYTEIWQKRIAIRIAEVISSIGYDVSFFSSVKVLIKPRKKERVCEWDKFVVYDREVDYRNWSKQQNIIIWLDMPTSDLVGYAKNKKIKTVVLFDWRKMNYSKEYLKTLSMLDVVVTTSRQAAKWLFEEFKLKKIIYIPWDTGYSPLKKTAITYNNIFRIFMPMHGDYMHCVSPDMFLVLDKLVRDTDNVEVCVSYNRRYAKAIGTNKILQKLVSQFNEEGKFKLIADKSSNINTILANYSVSDLTFIPIDRDGLGIFAVESLTMGKPVVCYDIATLNEYVSDDRNALLIPCQLKSIESQIPVAIFDHNEVWKTLRNALNSYKIESLCKHTHEKVRQNRIVFDLKWKEILTTLNNK